MMRSVCCVALLLLSFFGSAFGQPLVLNTNDTYPRSTPEGKGFHDLIVKEAFRRIGMQVSIVHLPAERALVNANEGIDDGNFVRIAGLEKKYPNLVMVPEKICDFEFAAFTKNPMIKIEDWDSLKPYNVGIINGWKILEANIVGTKSLTKVRSDEALFDLLMHDQADLIVFDRIQGKAMIKKSRLTGVKVLQPLLAKRDMYLYLNVRHAGLVPKVGTVLQEMKRDRTLELIMQSVLSKRE